MQATTDEESASPDARSDAPGAARHRLPHLHAPWIPAVLFGFIAAAIGGDLVSDVASGARGVHLLAEVVVMALSLVGLAAIWSQLRSAHARARTLQLALDGTRADLERWRGEAHDHLRGLGAAIDLQFRRWALTPAERDVALLLLKGLSLKDVAELRATTERTARQQSLGIYRKAGLAGRAELAAFFLEGLLLPSDGARDAAG
jgi:DNA-binding CsgD family transcriptional regulator